MKSVLCAGVLCLIIACANAGILIGPDNVVSVFNSGIATLRCQTYVSDRSNGTSIQWWEFGTSVGGVQISDHQFLLPGHPNRLRYSLNTTLPGQYDLIVINPLYVDGTSYECRDIDDALPNRFRASSQLIVIEGNPKCSSTVTSSIVLEGEAKSMECLLTYNASVGVDPLMTWTGPDPYTTGYNVGNNSVWSGVTFTVNRAMDTQFFTCKTNFTQKGFGGGDMADNIPTYEYLERSPQLLVNWGPKSTRHEPYQDNYNVGTVLVAQTDAFPAATFTWQGLSGPANLRNWYTQSFQIDATLVGSSTMRLSAKNTIAGQEYIQDEFFTLNVNAIPTTPSPGPSTTTTQAPARANCGDLTGKWASVSPSAVMCISVDYTTNGVIGGVFKNGTETEYSSIYGRVQLNTFDQGGFTYLSDDPSKGVLSFVLECQSCFGVETLIVSPIQNSALSVIPCGSTGVSNVFPDYYFTRQGTKPQCF